MVERAERAITPWPRLRRLSVDVRVLVFHLDKHAREAENARCCQRAVRGLVYQVLGVPAGKHVVPRLREREECAAGGKRAA